MKDTDFATGKPVNLSKPEEQVRQEYERILHDDFGYPKDHMDIEVPVQMGASRRFCDIAVYDSSKKNKIIGIVETKAPGQFSGERQLESYMSATPTCRWGVLTDRNQLICGTRDLKTGAVSFDPAFTIPKCGEIDAVILNYESLRPASNLKWIFRIINNALYANTNLARTEKQGAEMVRLIFCKLTDEYNTRKSNRSPEFQVRQGETEAQTRKRITKLWDETIRGWMGASIFSKGERIEIDNYSLRLIVNKLQGYSLLETDRDTVGDAFEIFSERQFAGEKGQFFTPRAVVKMVIGMLDPKQSESIIDPACGSGGFLIATLNHITRDIADESEKRRIAEHCLYGIDKDNDLAKICKAHMSIIGDGKSNIVNADSLKSPQEWDSSAISKLLDNGEMRKFDVVMTNPPFGSMIKVERKDILANYDLGHKWKNSGGAWEKTDQTQPTPPQVLFIELCLRLLKPSGRLGIVLPDGLLGNPGDGYIRNWLQTQATTLAVVDCPTATFMPHTGTKTSVMILKKKPSEPKHVFFAIAENCGHTMRGKSIYTTNRNIKEDFTAIAQNYAAQRASGHLGFYQTALHDGILVPRYYDLRILQEISTLEKVGDAKMVSINELVANGELSILGVPASAKSEDYDLHGTVRFIRTSDISGYELYENTQKKVSEQTYLAHKDKQDLRIHDILFVKDGDNKIGETAILLDEDDCHVLVQTHFKKIRPLQINPFLLMWLLNTEIVRKQIRQRVFNQSTLSTIGARILELKLPMPRDKNRKASIINEVENLISRRREFLRKLHQKMSGA